VYGGDCLCGAPILADTEDDRIPMCPDCSDAADAERDLICEWLSGLVGDIGLASIQRGEHRKASMNPPCPNCGHVENLDCIDHEFGQIGARFRRKMDPDRYGGMRFYADREFVTDAPKEIVRIKL
jgi:hypothetical protein